MKKFLSTILSLALIISFIFCSANQVNAKNVDKVPESSNNFNHEQIIEDYISSIDEGNWEKWLNCYSPSVKNLYIPFIQNKENMINGLGVLGITSAKINCLKKIDNEFAPKVKELASYFKDSNNYETYLLDLNLKVKKDTEYFHNGQNYKLVVLVKDARQWNVGIFSGLPEEYLSFLIKENTNSTAVRGIGYGLLNPGSTPSTIRVLDRNGSLYTVNFPYFIKNVTQNEIGNLNFNYNAIKAQAMAAKMTGWWCKVAHYRDAYGADIMYGDVAFINGVPINSNVANACNDISSYRMLSDSGMLFYAAYYAGSYGWGGQSSGQLRQNGANFLASEQGYSWSSILHYYYNNSSYNNPNVGIVQIY